MWRLEGVGPFLEALLRELLELDPLRLQVPWGLLEVGETILHEAAAEGRDQSQVFALALTLITDRPERIARSILHGQQGTAQGSQHLDASQLALANDDFAARHKAVRERGSTLFVRECCVRFSPPESIFCCTRVYPWINPAFVCNHRQQTGPQHGRARRIRRVEKEANTIPLPSCKTDPEIDQYAANKRVSSPHRQPPKTGYSRSARLPPEDLVVSDSGRTATCCGPLPTLEVVSPAPSRRGLCEKQGSIVG